MKVTVDRSKLLEAIQNTLTVIPNRSTLPVLSHFLLEVNNGKIAITATDLEICIRKEFEAQGEIEGKVTIPARKFYEIVKELPSEEVFIEETKNHGITIKGKNCILRLLGFSPDEYPNIPIIKGKQIIISSKQLRDLITKTYFAVSKEETRYVLNGILMELEKNRIRFVASDGKRLALAQEDITNSIEGKYIIPQKAIVELARLIEEEQDIKIVISEKENQIAFIIKDGKLTTRLIEGEFPHYEEVIPKENEKKIRIKKDLFLSALRRASIFTTVDSLATNLEVHKNKLIITKITPELGEAREEIEMEYNGDETVVSFNPMFLIDALKTIEEEVINFEVNGADKPGVIRINSKYIYLVLPMQAL
jgi:DNA polymerase-3 subunit beta